MPRMPRIIRKSMQQPSQVSASGRRETTFIKLVSVMSIFAAITVWKTPTSLSLLAKKPPISMTPTLTFVTESLVLSQSDRLLGSSSKTSQEEEGKENEYNNNCTVRFKDPNFFLCSWTHRVNFGDEVGPAIVSKMLENFFQCSADELLSDARSIERDDDTSHSCLVSVGSVIHFVRSNDFIWGAGVHPSHLNMLKKRNVTNLTISAVRGRKTEEVLRTMKDLEVPATLGYGDPGFLLPFVFPNFQRNVTAVNVENLSTKVLDVERELNDESTKKKHCLVAHLSDQGQPWLQGLKASDDVQVILPEQHWPVVVESLRHCNFVATSSLHGLIIADAIGVPARWFHHKDSASQNSEGTFKYLDYYGTLPSRRFITEPLRLREVGPLFHDDIHNYVYPPPIPTEEREALARQIVSTFPLHLFEKVVAGS